MNMDMRTGWLRSALGVLAASAILAAGTAAAQQTLFTVDPVFSLEIRFTVPHPVPTITGSDSNEHLPDMLFLDLPNIHINSPVGSHSAYLFNGETQLGVVINSLLGDIAPHYYLELGSFQTATSNFYAGPNRQAVIDFSSIYDGTMDGRVLFSISQGSFDYLSDRGVRGNLGLGGPGGSFGVGAAVTFVSVKLIALDPAQALDQLETEVVGVGPGKKLANAVKNAQTYYAAGDTAATCAVLTDFVYQVDSFASGKKPKVTAEQAAKLDSHAEATMLGIGCD